MTAAPEPSRRQLGLTIATALVAGNMIGSGVFLLPASLGRFGGISLVGWLATAFGAMVLALTFARLSRLFPRHGGIYAYTRIGFGDFPAFLVAWGYWLSICAGNAAIASAFVGYTGYFLPPLTESPALGAAVAVGSVWVLTWVNARGVREAGIVQAVTLVLKLVPLVAIGTLGLLFLDPDNFRPFNSSGMPPLSAVSATAALTLWAFLGLESATIPAGEIRDPARTIPRATVLGTALAATVYVLGTAAVMGVLAPATLSTSTAPFADAASTMWGGWAAGLVAAGAAVSCFGALNGWILLQGQLPFAAATDGLFPRVFARRGAHGTPVWALTITSVLTTVLVALNYTRGLVAGFTFFILLATLATLVPYVFCSLTLVLHHLRGPEPAGGRRLAGGVVVGGIALVYSLWAIASAGWETVYWGFLLFAAGVPAYAWMMRQANRR